MIAALYSAGIGGVSGVVWGLALDVDISTGLIVGLIFGALIGTFVVWLAQTASRDSARSGSDLQRGEAMFISGGLVGSLAALSIGLGLAVWLIRVLIG